VRRGSLLKLDLERELEHVAVAGGVAGAKISRWPGWTRECLWLFVESFVIPSKISDIQT
jgi:hypothetical protein